MQAVVEEEGAEALAADAQVRLVVVIFGQFL